MMIGYVNIGVILTIFMRLPLTYGTSLSVKEEQDAGTFVGIVNGVNDDYTWDIFCVAILLYTIRWFVLFFRGNLGYCR